jgi:hypothetical protein
MKLRKYVAAGMGIHAPFTLEFEGPSLKACMAELEVALQELEELSRAKAKEETKPVKVIRNPSHCALVKDMFMTSTKNYYFIRCQEYDEHGILIPAGLIQNDVDVKECFECKKFKPKEAK